MMLLIGGMKSYNFGIQPSIAYNLSNHWRIGIDVEIPAKIRLIIFSAII
jgi:hypothetical protein